MGLFLKNHQNYKDYVQSTNRNNNPFGLYTINNNQNSWTAAGIQLGTTSLYTILERIGDGKGSDNDNDKKIDNKTQKQIDELNKEINNILKKAKVSLPEDFKEAITKSESTQTTLSKSIEKTNIDISSLESIVIDAPAKKAALEKQLTGDNQKDVIINAQISDIDKQVNDIKEKQLPELKKNLEDQKISLKNEQLHEAELLTFQGQVENLQNRILELKGKSLSDEVKYDVKKETEDLSNFNKALQKFKENPSVQTAGELVTAFESGDNGVQNKTAQKAFEFVKKQYPQFFDKISMSKQI